MNPYISAPKNPLYFSLFFYSFLSANLRPLYDSVHENIYDLV